MCLIVAFRYFSEKFALTSFPAGWAHCEGERESALLFAHVAGRVHFRPHVCMCGFASFRKRLDALGLIKLSTDYRLMLRLVDPFWCNGLIVFYYYFFIILFNGEDSIRRIFKDRINNPNKYYQINYQHFYTKSAVKILCLTPLCIRSNFTFLLKNVFLERPSQTRWRRQSSSWFIPCLHDPTWSLLRAGLHVSRRRNPREAADAAETTDVWPFRASVFGFNAGDRGFALSCAAWFTWSAEL